MADVTVVAVVTNHLFSLVWDMRNPCLRADTHRQAWPASHSRASKTFSCFPSLEQ